MVEVDSLDQFDALVSQGATTMWGWRVQGLDLSNRTEELLALAPAGALLLGCTTGDEADAWLKRGGAMVFPEIPEVPFDPYRTRLYTAAELYDGIGTAPYQQTPDARIYAWSRQQLPTVAGALARSLHDHAIDQALDDDLRGRNVVGVMGGHAVERGSATYSQAARLGRGLSRGGLLVVTGGGPGAMEAANLGAYLTGHDDDVLSEAIGLLARAPLFAPSVTEWVRAAFDVRARWPEGGMSVGIPTWFYGHEPPNAFAAAVAKYFQNALREDTLLHRCDAGIVFLPGAAGTVQEIFQDACENYYSDKATVASMVLVGRTHWTRDVPVWPLLRQLSRGRAMAAHVWLVDSIDEALELLCAGPARQPAPAAAHPRSDPEEAIIT
jgi:predicted Rossmann-fold nucleotide-binding protein